MQSALKEGAASLDFLGQTLRVSPGAAVFVTLNPAGKGYGGRSRLPDNLKQMFRCAAGHDHELRPWHAIHTTHCCFHMYRTCIQF